MRTKTKLTYRITYTAPSFRDGSPVECFEECRSYGDAREMASLLVSNPDYRDVVIYCPITSAKGKVLYYDRKEVHP